MKAKYRTPILLVFPLCLFAACGGPADPGAADAAEANEARAAFTPAPPPPDSAEETVQYVVDGLLEHEPNRVWSALPASYQADVNRVIAAFSQKMDVDVYDRGFALASRAGHLLRDKKELFLASEMLPATVNRAEAAANWEAVTGLIETLASSDVARVETLASLDLEKFLGSTGRALLAQAERAALAGGQDIFEDLRNLQVEVVESGEDEATLRFSDGEEDWEAQLVRVDDRWVPRELAEGWSGSLAEALGKIEAMSAEELQAMKPQILGIYGMVEGVIAQLEVAETVEQLDAALQVAMFSVLGSLMGSGQQGMEPGTP